MTSLPFLTYCTAGLPEKHAFEGWRAHMAPLFDVAPARFGGTLPRGSATSVLVGEMIANRTVFTAQHVTRDAALIAATPDHLLLQAYITGGFHGDLAGETVTIGKGMVAVTDLRRTVDVRAATSNTVGLAIPRTLAVEIGADALTPSLDPARNRLLAAWLIAFFRRLPRMSTTDIPALTAEASAFLGHLADPSSTIDAPEGPETDPHHRARAEDLIRAELGSRDISPAWLAERLELSRATLYRLFAPLGGVMRHVQEQRVMAAYAALSDVLEMRSLAQMASDLGFGSAALFSRSFHERFGLSPSAFRQAVGLAAEEARPPSLDPIQAWWARLGEKTEL